MAGLLLECSELSAVFMVHQYVSGAYAFDPVPECSVARAGFKAGTKNAGAGSYGGHDDSHFTGCSGQTGAGLVDVHLSNNILFIGAYLKKNVEIPKLSTAKLCGALLISWCAFTALNLYVSRGQNFIWTYWGDEWGGAQNVINAVLVFLIINSIHYPPIKTGTAKLIAYVSKITLPAYLLSWIPDQLNYPILNTAVNPMWMRLKYFPLMVGSSIVVSLVLAAVVHECTQLILKGAHSLKSRAKG